MKQSLSQTIAVITIVIILIALALFMLLKPTQEMITEDILQTKEENTSMYLDFIANNLVGGGPPKDGIPAVDDPIYLTPEQAEQDEGLADDDTVFGINYKGTVIAYPQSIMYWHEIANEITADGEEISVTYCPLTGSVIGYKDVNLGVSGKLYNSNLVTYDRATDSYYPQILGTGVTGPDKGRTLDTFPVSVTSWKQWKNTHPDTAVLSRNTGYTRAYDNPPYEGYDEALRIWFPVAAESDQFHSKRIIHGIEFKNTTLVVLKEPLQDVQSLEYPIENDTLTITHNPALDTIEVEAASGLNVKHFDAYWFAWYAYHPDTLVVNP